MARRQRPYVYIKKDVTCDIPLDDVVAIPFDRLKEKFTSYAQDQDFDLKDVNITEKGICGSFTDKSGVSFEINIKPEGNISKLEGSISKTLQSSVDSYLVGKSVEEFTDALFQG